MITVRGVCVATVTAVIYGLAVIFHYQELGLLAAGGLFVVVVGLVWVVRRPRLLVTRSVEPSRVTRGDVAVGLLTVTNGGRYPISPTFAVERVGSELISLSVPRLPPNQAINTTYRLPTEKRAVVDIGPLSVGRQDPFGLWRTSQRLGTVERMWVHPVTHRLVGIPAGTTKSMDGPDADRDPQGTITFHALREYVPGDDLRRVHWRSSARMGTLMVRENIDTSVLSMVLLLDVSASSHSPETFESAVEAAASVAVTVTRSGYPVRIVTTDGRSVRARGISSDALPLLDLLSEVSPTDEGRIVDVVPSLAYERRGDVLIAITGQPSEADVLSVSALAKRFNRCVLGMVHPKAMDQWCPTSPGVLVLRGTNGVSFAEAWNTAVG